MTDNCFLCGYEDVSSDLIGGNKLAWWYQCPVCGKYIITDKAKEDINRKPHHKHMWASIAAERNLQKKTFQLTRDKNDEQGLKRDHQFIRVEDLEKIYPASVVERLDRAIQNLGRMASEQDEIGKDIDIFNDPSTKNHYFLFAQSHDEAFRILSLLEQQQLVKMLVDGETIKSVSVTAKGWQKIAELEKQWEQSDKVFLAMWFDKNTTSNLREAVRKAVKAAGYDSPEIAVDETPHNDFITNKIINMITDAKFVIADFTCSPEGEIAGEVRGGVYFEAGLARGQGKEVIHTCSEKTKNAGRLHFDVNQINTIFWKEEKDAEGNVVLKSYDSDFIDVLKHRIIATVGKGKHYVEVD